ncbi:MAG: hypothetical protein K6G63_07980, partial [Eubacterium sp.]|nr:hypothetical protein [Eubacterium sp.]
MQVGNDDYILAPFCAVEHKGMIYCTVKDTNIIMRIDIKKKEYQEIKAPYDVNLKGINIIQDCLVCTLKENALIRYDLKKKIWSIEKFNTPCKNKVYPYLTVASYEEKELVISGREDKLVRPDLDDCEVVLPGELARDAEGTLLFRGFKLQENKIHLFPRGSRGVLTYDFDSGNCDYNEIKYNKECIRIHMKKSDCILSNGDIIVENDAYNLSDYIDFVKVKKQNNIGVMT